MSLNNIAVVQKAFEAFQTGCLEGAEAYIASDYLNHRALDSADGHGAEEFKASVQWVRRAFSDLNIEVKELLCTGERVVARVLVSGRHTGDYLDFAPTGKRFFSEHVHFFRIRDGKVIEHHMLRDDLGAMTQLGLFP
ncbi:MAG: ester cyclase [Meiothermus sp.]